MEQQGNGFTLVELAIALMVIGLLIGGVLKGQELIDNARTIRLLKDINDYKTAVTIFRSTYDAWPGDMRRPASRLPDCSADPCSVDGTGEGKIGTDRYIPRTFSTPDPALSGEYRNFWVHLAKAGMISGVDTTIPHGSPFSGETGIEVPKTPFASIGITVSYYINATHWGEPAIAGNYLVITPFGTGAALPTRTAYQIDSKGDDGLPGDGTTRVLRKSFGSGPSIDTPDPRCVADGETVYLNNNERVCSLAVLMPE